MAHRPLRTRPVLSIGGELLYPEDYDAPVIERDRCEPDECPDCGRFLPDCECADENAAPEALFQPDE